ncbi:MAG: hypothetical protein AAGJ35_14740 [Myxococcota bacterium]
MQCDLEGAHHARENQRSPPTVSVAEPLVIAFRACSPLSLFFLCVCMYQSVKEPLPLRSPANTTNDLIDEPIQTPTDEEGRTEKAFAAGPPPPVVLHPRALSSVLPFSAVRNVEKHLKMLQPGL